MDKTRVLIVDDEKEFVETLAARMVKRGLSVDTALSGAEALKHVSAGEYDAVVLDLAMPNMDGIETLSRMLDMNPDLQVILLTGHATIEKGVEAMKIGAFEFLEKPVKLDRLVQRVEDARHKREEISEMKIDDMIENILKRRGW